MVSRQETARPLLTPGEVMQLPPDQAIVLVSGLAPVRAFKLRHYEDANFVRRLRPPPPSCHGPNIVTARRRAPATGVAKPEPSISGWQHLRIATLRRLGAGRAGSNSSCRCSMRPRRKSRQGVCRGATAR